MMYRIIILNKEQSKHIGLESLINESKKVTKLINALLIGSKGHKVLVLSASPHCFSISKFNFLVNFMR